MRTLLALPILLVLAGCGADLAQHDYRLSHPVAVENRSAVAVFDRPADGQPLGPYDRDRLARLAAEHLRRGSGPVEVAAGAKPGEEEAAKVFVTQLAEALRAAGAQGVEAKVVVGGPEQAGSPKPGEAVVRVPVWTAKVEECGSFERGLNPDYGNAPNSNWGCSIQRNRALMLQNPADLVRARDSTGRDGNRAADVLDKYGKGQATASQAEAGASAGVSTVGK